MYSAFLVISICVLFSWSEISSVSGSGQRASNRVHSIQDRIRHDPGPIRRIPTIPCSLYSNHPLCRRRRPIRRPPVCRSGSGRDCIPRHSNFPKLPNFSDPPMLLPDTIVRRSKRSVDRNGQSSLGERRVVDYRKRISSCGRVGRSYSKLCNRCVCTPNGEICTMRQCLVDFRRAKEFSSTPENRRAKRAVDSSVNNGLRERLGLFDRTIAFPSCGIIGRAYKSECNTCICTTRGPMCTMRACLPPRDFRLRRSDFRGETHRSKRSAGVETEDFVARLLARWRCESGSVKQKCCSRCTCSTTGYWQCDYRGRCDPDLCNYDQIVEEDERIRNQILGQTDQDVTEHEVDDVTESEDDVTTEETPVLDVNTEDNQAADRSESHRSKRSAGAETDDFVARLLARWRCERGSVKQKCCSRCTCSTTGYWQCDYRGRCNPDLCNYDQIVEEDERIRNQILGQTDDDVTEHEVDDVTESENDVTTEETPVLDVNTEDNQAADSSGSHRSKRSAGAETEDIVARLLARWRCESGSVKQKCCSRCTCSTSGYWQCDYRGRCNPDLCNYDQIVEEDERIRNQMLGQTDDDVTLHEVDDATESENGVTTEETPVPEVDVNTEDNQAADISESHRSKRSVRPAQDNRRLTMARDIFGRQCVPGARKEAPDCCNSCVCTAQGYWRCGTRMVCVNPGCGHRRNPTISRQKRAAGANPPDNYTRGRWPSFLTGRRVPQTAKQVCVTNANVGKSFYDGCNTCRCSGIARAACTRKRCFRSLIRH